MSDADSIVLEGWLTKRGGMVKSWKKRWFQLSLDGVLRYYSSKGEKKPSGVINIKELRNVESVENDTNIPGVLFHVTVPSRTYYLIAETSEDARKWQRAVNLVFEGKIKSSKDLYLLRDPTKPVDETTFKEILDQPKETPTETTVLPEARPVPQLMKKIDVDKNRPEWESFHKRNMQIKTFTNWMNYRLSSRNIEIKDIGTDLCDGVALANLVEVITESVVSCNPNPTHHVHRIQNINHACKFMRDQGKDLPVVPAEAIIGGNVKQIMDLIWGIIYFYEIEPKEHGGRTGADGLLCWLQESTSTYPIKITDFSSCFQDGMILCALVDRFYPKIDFVNLTLYKKRENVKLALDTALEVWHVPRLFDVEDIVSEEPDTLSLLVYIAFCFQHVNLPHKE